MQLQKEAKDKEMANYELREAMIQLRAEKEQLEVQQAEDRRRNEELLSLTQPLATQEITFMRDVRPHKLTSGTPPPDRASEPSGELRAGHGADPSATVELVGRDPRGLPMFHSMGGNEGGGGAPQGATRLLRTVYLPGEKTDALLMTIDSLTRELRAHKQLADERYAHMLAERSRSAEEERVRRERLLARNAQLEERVAELGTLLRNNEKECATRRPPPSGICSVP